MKSHLKQRKYPFIENNGFPLLAQKVLPNDLCICGSGKKAKKCCGAKTRYAYSKLNEIQKAELAARIKIEQERKAKLESESKLSPEKQPSQT